MADTSQQPEDDDDRVTGVRFGPLRAWIEAEARTRGCSLSEVIKRAVEEHRANLQKDAISR
jgi:hypothetical protein